MVWKAFPSSCGISRPRAFPQVCVWLRCSERRPHQVLRGRGLSSGSRHSLHFATAPTPASGGPSRPERSEEVRRGRGRVPRTRGRPGGRFQGPRPRLELCPHDFPNKWFKHESKCNERVHLLSGELQTKMTGSGVQAQTWARTCRGPVCSQGSCRLQVPGPARCPHRPPPDDPVPPPRRPGALPAAQVWDGGAAATSRCPEAGLPRRAIRISEKKQTWFP